MKTYEELHDELLLMDDDNLAAINNIYCERMGTLEDYIYNMGDFDEVMQKLGVTAIKKVVAFGRFNPADEYFSFDGEEKLESYGWRNRIMDNPDAYNDLICSAFMKSITYNFRMPSQTDD